MTTQNELNGSDNFDVTGLDREFQFFNIFQSFSCTYPLPYNISHLLFYSLPTKELFLAYLNQLENFSNEFLNKLNKEDQQKTKENIQNIIDKPLKTEINIKEFGQIKKVNKIMIEKELFNPDTEVSFTKTIWFDKKLGTYKGEWKDGKRDGKGVMKYENNREYDGEWKDDKKEGKGIMLYEYNGKYDGYWKNDKKEGKGIYIYGNETFEKEYNGDWKNDIKEGIGKMKYKNGDVYEGEWYNEKVEKES